MESIRWRYQPEFMISVTIDGQAAGSALQIRPTRLSAGCMHNYGVIAHPSDGSILCSVKQHHDGTNFIPAIDLTDPCVFSFAILISRDAPDLDFYANGTSTFGRRMLYLNNLNNAGAIDSNEVANSVQLTPAADVAVTDAGSLCPGIASVTFNPGTYTQLRAGKIQAGAAVSFSIDNTIAPTDERSSIDFSTLDKGSYLLRLEGGTPMEEPVIVDPTAASSNIQGVIEIFRDSWLSQPQPRNYHFNYTSV